ncbi:MAG: hypothetical protein IT452_12150 [Planctomycetia bacterium]|nr:hypothetical protein [Planctomycetia bacterium]
MRLRTALALALLALPAAAEDARAKVDEFIAEATGGQDWEKRQKLLRALLRTPGAAKAFVEAAAARDDIEQSAWGLANAAQPLLDSRRAEIAAPLKALLGADEAPKVRFAITCIQYSGLTGELAADLYALASSQDFDKSGSATMALTSSRDPRVIELLLKESGEEGERGSRGLRMLAGTGAPAARERLRAVASNPKESEDRRGEAVSGLSQAPTAEDVEVAKGLLASGVTRLVEPCLNLLVQARAVVPVETLKGVRQKGDDWRDAMLDKLMSLAGDEDGAKACLRRAKGGSEWDRVEWYAWAGRSGLKAVKEKLEKEFGEETNEEVRMGILNGIGECGDAGSVDLIAKYLTHPEKGNQAMRALGSLARRNPAALDAVLDRLVETTGVAMFGVDSFPYTYMENAAPAQRAVLLDAYLRLLERVNERPRIRQSVLSAIAEMARPDFEMGEDALGRWKEWWKANREAWSKAPPKSR